MKLNRKFLTAFLLLAAAAVSLTPALAAGPAAVPAGAPAKLIPSSMIKPAYPEAERKAGVEGAVLLVCEIGIDGVVAKIATEQQVDGHPAFTEAAIAAVKQWRFEPARESGKPVASSLKVPVKFALDGDHSGKK